MLLRRKAKPKDRVQLMYVNRLGREIVAPWSHVLTNLFLPESLICRFCLRITRYIPQKWIPRSFRVTILQYYLQDVKSGKIKHFADAYQTIWKEGYSPMSGAITQAWNHLYAMLRMKRRYLSAYIIRPEEYNSHDAYPLVVYCHGNAGNWLLYQGIWMGLKNCIVLSIGTVGLSGSFQKSQIQAVFSFWIPLLKSKGYIIDERQIHLMGLSAGGTAVRIAKAHFPQFASLTFLNTPLIIKGYRIKTNIVGGGKDACCTYTLRDYEILKSSCDIDILWYPDDHHFLLVNETQKVLDFLNCRLLCKVKKRIL